MPIDLYNSTFGQEKGRQFNENMGYLFIQTIPSCNFLRVKMIQYYMKDRKETYLK